jgi:hypothetical protein
MEFIVGVALAVVICGAASLLGMDRDRAFYPTMLMAVASYYVAFSVVDGSLAVLMAEAFVCAAFIVMAVLGFARSQWFVAGGLAGHGAMDLVHHLLVNNTGVPAAWPGFCSGYDLMAALYLAAVLVLRRQQDGARVSALREHGG